MRDTKVTLSFTESVNGRTIKIGITTNIEGSQIYAMEHCFYEISSAVKKQVAEVFADIDTPPTFKDGEVLAHAIFNKLTNSDFNTQADILGLSVEIE